MGYAAALSVILLLVISMFSKVAHGLFGERD
jgi:ABC-type sugar transport system permease subunit